MQQVQGDATKGMAYGQPSTSSTADWLLWPLLQQQQQLGATASTGSGESHAASIAEAFSKGLMPGQMGAGTNVLPGGPHALDTPETSYHRLMQQHLAAVMAMGSGVPNPLSFMELISKRLMQEQQQEASAGNRSGDPGGGTVSTKETDPERASQEQLEAAEDYDDDNNDDDDDDDSSELNSFNKLETISKRLMMQQQMIERIGIESGEANPYHIPEAESRAERLTQEQLDPAMVGDTGEPSGSTDNRSERGSEEHEDPTEQQLDGMEAVASGELGSLPTEKTLDQWRLQDW